MQTSNTLSNPPAKVELAGLAPPFRWTKIGTERGQTGRTPIFLVASYFREKGDRRVKCTRLSPYSCRRILAVFCTVFCTTI